MKDLSYLIENLKNLAKESNNQELLKKIESKEFLNELSSVKDVLNKLDLEITKKYEDFSDSQEVNLKISRALTENYFVMYYVDVISNEYVGYTNCQDYRSLTIQEKGEDFFKDLLSNAKRVIYKDDFESIISLTSKDKLLKETKNGQTFSFTYRLMLKNKPTYVALKAIRFIDDPNHLIIGVENIDKKMRREIEIKKQALESVTYNNIAMTLSRDYFVIYYVDIITSKYIQYSINADIQALNVEDQGEDFFADSQMNARRYIAPEDQDKFMKAITKEAITAALAAEPVFRLTYRQILKNKATFVAMKCMRINADSSHILIAVSNIDSQVRKENEYKSELAAERNLARTDALTGASNKYSYNEFEKEINKHIANNSIDQFSVVLCDINNLKIINDTLGHDVGDMFIKEAKEIISSTFKNSTVFRVGGDEFVCILDGNDYYIRDYLLQKIKDRNDVNSRFDKVTVACGMADFVNGVDKELVDVFRRADELMYLNKREQKIRYNMK